MVFNYLGRGIGLVIVFTPVALLLILARRWLALLAFAVSAGMAWSRTYLQVHWLLDVLAGAVLGTGVAPVVFAFAQRKTASRP